MQLYHVQNMHEQCVSFTTLICMAAVVQIGYEAHTRGVVVYPTPVHSITFIYTVL